MERRVLIAVLLSFLVLYAYQALFPAPPDSQKPVQSSKTATAPNASASERSNATPAQGGAGTTAPSGAAPTAPPAGTAPAGTAPAGTAPDIPPQPPARDLVVDTDSVHAVFTTRGGVLKSWQLKKYRDSADHPLEVLAGYAPANAPLPFTLATDDAALSSRLAASTYTVGADGRDAHGWHAQLDYTDDAGVHAQKTFSIDFSKPYVVVVSASLTKNGQPLPTTIAWGPALGSGIVVKSRTYNPPPQPVFFKDGKVTRTTPSKIAQQADHEGVFGFGGVDDHYFLTAIVKPAAAVRVSYAAVDVPVENVPDGAHYVAWSVRYPAAAAGQTFFAGPKDFDVLAAVDRDLVRSIDFGMFAWLVVPLLRSLKWVNGYVGNYGWSLILLTVLINLAMFPLRHKSVVSMRKMQEIQPEVKAIQDRYAKLKMSDPARAKMNQEMMQLYKERGVNPASGCVPMLLTLPVLFAFYSMLSVAIELRGAPFVLWIHDLSARDPYFVFPVLMGATMFVQQKMTPTGGVDPTQQRVMTFMMPVMMTGMFLWAASGLVIYWTVSNLWGIGQQMLTNRIIGPPAQRTVRPPAERQLKNAKVVGGSKTTQAKERES